MQHLTNVTTGTIIISSDKRLALSETLKCSQFFHLCRNCRSLGYYMLFTLMRWTQGQAALFSYRRIFLLPIWSLFTICKQKKEASIQQKMGFLLFCEQPVPFEGTLKQSGVLSKIMKAAQVGLWTPLSSLGISPAGDWKIWTLTTIFPTSNENGIFLRKPWLGLLPEVNSLLRIFKLFPSSPLRLKAWKKMQRTTHPLGWSQYISAEAFAEHQTIRESAR